MDSKQLEGKWNQLKGGIKQKFAQLTDDDLTFAEGKFEEMLGKVQEKIGLTKEKLAEELENLKEKM